MEHWVCFYANLARLLRSLRSVFSLLTLFCAQNGTSIWFGLWAFEKQPFSAKISEHAARRTSPPPNSNSIVATCRSIFDKSGDLSACLCICDVSEAQLLGHLCHSNSGTTGARGWKTVGPSGPASCLEAKKFASGNAERNGPVLYEAYWQCGCTGSQTTSPMRILRVAY